jgi:hypothetical protein
MAPYIHAHLSPSSGNGVARHVRARARETSKSNPAENEFLSRDAEIIRHTVCRSAICIPLRRRYSYRHSCKLPINRTFIVTANGHRGTNNVCYTAVKIQRDAAARCRVLIVFSISGSRRDTDAFSAYQRWRSPKSEELAKFTRTKHPISHATLETIHESCE